MKIFVMAFIFHSIIRHFRRLTWKVNSRQTQLYAKLDKMIRFVGILLLKNKKSKAIIYHHLPKTKKQNAGDIEELLCFYLVY